MSPCSLDLSSQIWKVWCYHYGEERWLKLQTFTTVFKLKCPFKEISLGNCSYFLLLFLSVCIQHNGHLNDMCRTEGCALAYSDSSGLDVG